jgi:hypothetical protein
MTLRRDWRQFRLLSRDAVRQSIDAALFSREADPMEFALWMLALVATPPAFFAFRQIFLYTALVKAPPEVVEQIALAHRMFFVTYGMLAAALLAALTWDTLFPDGRDQEIVGVLPVRPQTFAAAKLGAAVTLGLVFTAAINIPAAVIYTAVSSAHPALRNSVGLLAGQILGTSLGALLVYFTLLTARGLAAIVFGARAGAWLGAVLQLVTVVLLVEVFFFLPGVLGTLVKAMLAGDPTMMWLPPVWFASLHAWVAGNSNPLLASPAGLAVISTAIAGVAAVPMYLLPARWLGRRAMETRARERATSITSAIKSLAHLTMASPPVRAIFGFAIASLLRSRQHLLVLATYFGLAIATCVASIILIEVRGSIKLTTPASWILALPLVFMFFMVIGLRASFRLPTDIEANWPFRMAQPSLAACFNAAALVMFSLVALPLAVLTLVITAPLWSVVDGIKAALLQLLAGVLLIECVLANWTKIPFACGHAPSPDVLKAWWPAYLLTLYLYAFKLSDWQVVALRSTTALAWYVALTLTVIGIVRLVRQRKTRSRTLEFDAAYGHTLERLNLSGALN